MENPIVMYCYKCKKKTNHTVRGFKYWNRRYQCNECGEQLHDRNNQR